MKELISQNEPEFLRDSLGRKRYPHKYKNGVPSEEITEDQFAQALEKTKFPSPLRDRSYLTCLFWIGARKTEPLEMKKEDIRLEYEDAEEEILLLKIPAKKFGHRGGEIQLSLSWLGVELIKQQWIKTKKGKRIWRFSAQTGWRIVHRAFPGKSPHFLRYRVITRLRKLKDEKVISLDDIKSWTGLKRDSSIEHYGLKTQAGIHKISEVLKNKIA